MPLSEKSVISAAARLSTSSGKEAGPAEKLNVRPKKTSNYFYLFFVFLDFQNEPAPLRIFSPIHRLLLVLSPAPFMIFDEHLAMV
jgi:hypothetical protein